MWGLHEKALQKKEYGTGWMVVPVDKALDFLK